ncbi:MAG: hypothetical protein ACYSUH_09875 [Planctomycetota bacterium]
MKEGILFYKSTLTRLTAGRHGVPAAVLAVGAAASIVAAEQNISLAIQLMEISAFK